MKKLGAILIAAALIITIFAAYVTFGTTSTPSSTPGIIVPLYSYPGSVWTSLIQQHLAYPSVPIIAVINPSTGSGSASNPDYVSGIQSLTGATDGGKIPGITVIGYVYTDYGHSSTTIVESNITAYKNWYGPSGLSGILFDSMGTTGTNASYYTTLKNFATTEGLSLTVGAPGNGVPSSFIGIFNMYLIYEGSGLPTMTLLAASTGGYASSNFAMDAYSVSSAPTQAYVSSASSYVSYMYITDATVPNPYTVLPSYLSTLLAELSPPPTTTTTTSVSTCTNAGCPTTTTTTSTSVVTTTSSTTALGGFGWQQIVTTVNQNPGLILLVLAVAVMVAAVVIARRK